MATNNAHKLDEARHILGEEYSVLGLADIGFNEDPAETSATLEGNALQKARYVHDKCGLDCFADDTGLEVEALDGAPGVYTARFGSMNGYGESHDSDANIRCLLDKLGNADSRKARFRTAIALIRNGREHLFEGVVEGRILHGKTGDEGFGYDPVFAPDEAGGLSFAQMRQEDKNVISHRGRAIAKMADFLRKAVLLLAILLPAASHARQIGTWNVFPSYFSATKVAMADDVVYTLTKDKLMAYDTKDSEVRLYDNIRNLSDVEISFIGYSKEAKRLLIVYANSNVDLLDADDNVYNMPALMDKSVIGKEVTGICMDGPTAYLATGFGMVEADLKSATFANSFRLSLNCTSVATSDTHIFLAATTGIYRCAKDKDKHLASNWELVSQQSDIREMVWFNGMMYVTTSSQLLSVNVETGETKVLSGGSFLYLGIVNDEVMCCKGLGIYTISQDGTFKTLNRVNTWSGVCYRAGTYWVADGKNGLRGYKFVDGQYIPSTSSIQPNSPKNSLSYHLKWVGERLLVTGGINTTDAIYNEPTTMMYEDGVWTNFEELTDPDPTLYPKINLANTTDVVQDPDDPTHHFASLHRNGLCEYRNAKFVNLWNCNNSPLKSILPLSSKKLNYVSCAGLKYDGEGNLWMFNAQTDTIVRILRNNGKWAALYYDEIENSSLCDNYVMHSSGIVVASCRWKPNNSGHRGLFFLDTKGTLDNVKDDKHILHSTITNQDGTSYAPEYFYGMAEDMDGRLWFGTDLGLFVADDLSQIFSNNYLFTQVKINRNDGSGLADYLLSGVSISCIAIDGANRKWIGTQASGAFLVSADGQETIHHFTAEDSPLLSNSIQDIAVSPVTGEVMFATEKGLCSYMSDATQAASELNEDDVLCFPNPVRSDYTGPIVVRGLTMDSEVKIVSSGGQLVCSGRSLGGEFTWNGCNRQGKRVASGIYHVIANNYEGKKAIVTRIVVIK